MTTSTGRSGQSGPQGGSHALTQKRNNLGAVPFAKTRVQKRGSGNSQADQRREHHMTDQHGRPWSCSVEIRSGMPTGGIANDFNAPWLPDQNALVVNPNDTAQLWIDYRLMWNERMQALGAYHKQAVALCTDKSWPVPTKGVYANDIRRVLGDPPKPLQPVKAAAQENPWIMGWDETPDPRLVEYVVPIEERDADLDDGEDYSADGFEAALREDETDEERVEREERELAERETDVLAGRRAAAFAAQAAAFDPDELQADGVDDYTVDQGAYADDAGTIGDGSTEEPEEPEEHDEPEDEDVLGVLDDAADDGLSGRRIAPQKTDLAQRQAPRRPAQTSRPGGKRQKKGKHTRARTMQSLRAKAGTAAQGSKPRTLADGARPAIGKPLGNEVLVTSKGAE